MTFKFTPFLFLLVFAFWLITTAANGQMCTGKNKVKPVDPPSVSNIEETNVSPPQKPSISIPPNYKPPVANPALIIFPETIASRKKQLKLRKKRQKLKKAKKQGCIAIAL